MEKYLYLSLLPEALIASMLPPEEFGNYLAIGTKKRTRGQAMFFEVDPDFTSTVFHLDQIDSLLVEHPDGSPKRSKYLSIYRVLENIPIEALRKLYLVTDDGRVLGLEKQNYVEPTKRELHLYQQFLPVNPRIVSSYNPKQFCTFITDISHPVSVPKIVFCDLELNGLATDPVFAPVENLPYKNIDHLRDCLVGLQERPEKPTKTVMRYMRGDVLYRTIKNGFFVGDQKAMAFYPFPSVEQLEGEYHAWWRSALTVAF